MEITANKFIDGQVVYAKKAPNIKLVVRLGVDAIYYCRVADNLKHKELLFFERELLAEHDNARKWSNS